MMVAVVAQRAAPSEAAAEIQPVAAPRASGVVVHTADDQAVSVVTSEAAKEVAPAGVERTHCT